MEAATIPPVMSGLSPSLKLFLHSKTSSGNVPLMWPPQHDNGLLGQDMTHDTCILFKFLHPTIIIIIIIIFFGSVRLLNKLKIEAKTWLIYKQTNMNELFIKSSSSYL